MNLITPFSILKEGLKNRTPQKLFLHTISCYLDNNQVPIKECGGEFDVENNLSNIDFVWRVGGYSTNLDSVVYADWHLLIFK